MNNLSIQGVHKQFIHVKRLGNLQNCSLFGKQSSSGTSLLVHEDQQAQHIFRQFHSTPWEEPTVQQQAVFFTFDITQPARERIIQYNCEDSAIIWLNRKNDSQRFKCVRCKSKSCTKTSHPEYTHAGNEDMNITWEATTTSLVVEAVEGCPSWSPSPLESGEPLGWGSEP